MKEEFLNQPVRVNCKSDGRTCLFPLIKLKCLTPAVRQWLKESLSIKSVEELARCSTSDISCNLEYEGKYYSKQEVEEWIAQARIFVAQQSQWQTSANFVVSLQNSLVGSQIEYRTTVYFIEADRKAAWPGIRLNGIHELMREHLQQSYQKDRGEPITRIFLPGEYSETENSMPETVNVPGVWAEFLTKESSEDQIPNFQVIVQSPDMESVNFPLTQPEANENSDFSPEEATESVPDKAPPMMEAEDVPSDEVGETLESAEPVVEEVQTELEEKILEKETVEPLKLEITQLKVYPPSEVAVPESENAEDTEAESDEDQIEEDDQEEETVIVVDATKRILMDEIPPSKPFDLEVCFQLAGTGALELTQRPLPYHTEVYGENRTTQQKLTLGHAPVGHLVDGQLTYTCRLTGVSLSKVGTYRFQVVTHLENAPVSPDLLELPFVQVA